MDSGKWLLFFSHILLNLVILIFAQPGFRGYHCISRGNYTNDSIYKKNLETIPSSLSSYPNITYNFYNFSIGQNPDIVNVIALCQGDVEAEFCSSCVDDAIRKLRQLCPNQREAIGWYEKCMLRYSSRFIFGRMEISPNMRLFNGYVFSDVNQFNQVFKPLLDSLRIQASKGGPLGMFATNETIGPDNSTIYGLMQCTPDLSEAQCEECLYGATADFQKCCDGQRGITVLSPSCNVRYETAPFYSETGPFYRETPAHPEKDDNATQTVFTGKKITTQTIIIIVVLTTIFVIIVVCICIFISKRKQRENNETVDEIISVESLQYDFGTIRIATNYFSDTNKLGQGGFGAVYKGRFPNGQEIAVKRLSRDSRQGELEFKNEVLLVAKLQHRSLVRLIGFCLEGTERILIYEYVPNSSLNHFLFDPVKRSTLDWDMRYKIIEGVARGLLYLHEDSRLRIIHRDLKASNILLDANMNPKISDFGMARLFALDETHGDTRRIVGTYGYMAPEYAINGQFSVKTDVFSFGVLVLEIVSGQKHNYFQNGENEEHLLSYAWKIWHEGTASNLIDSTLGAHSVSIDAIVRCINIGLLCVQENVADRPSMASVVFMLNSFSITLQVPSKPAFFMHSSIDSERSLLGETNSRTNESRRQSKSKSHRSPANEASISELDP